MADSTTQSRGGMAEKSVFWMICVAVAATFVVMAIVIATTVAGEDEEYAAEAENPETASEELETVETSESVDTDVPEEAAAVEGDEAIEETGEGVAAGLSDESEEQTDASGEGEVAASEGNEDATEDDSEGTSEDASGDEGGSDASMEGDANGSMTEGTDSNEAASDGEEDTTPEAVEQGAADLVDDPDNGQPNEPDGGAEEFFPTPSGPEGSDGNALTAD